MNPDTTLQIPAQVMSREVGDEVVLLDLANGTYFGLEGVGRYIWNSIVDGHSIDQIVDRIVTEFDVDEDQAQTDLLAFAEDLLARGLLAK